MSTAVGAVIIGFVVFVAGVAQFVMYGAYKRRLESWGQQNFEAGTNYPEPRGRHHGLSQPEDWTAADWAEFEPAQPLTPAYAPEPLPKRKPAAIEMAETMRPLFDELYGKDGQA